LENKKILKLGGIYMKRIVVACGSGVATSQTYDKPMINGIKFLTGMGMAEEFEKLKELLK